MCWFPLVGALSGGLVAGAFAILGVMVGMVGQRGGRAIRLDDLAERREVERRDAVVALLDPVATYISGAEVESLTIFAQGGKSDLMEWVNTDSAILLRESAQPFNTPSSDVAWSSLTRP